MKSQDLHKYVRHYCCLYHFAGGKAEKATSPCYNHVPLGIIHPPSQSRSRQPKPSPSSLQIISKTQSINYHTHDVNQIEHKASLPKRLAYPRLYVEQITKRNCTEKVYTIATYQAFLKKKQYQEIFLLYKMFAKATGFKTELDVVKSYKKFADANQIINTSNKNHSLSQICFSKSQFINYLIELGLGQKQAEEFWNVAYSQGRFLDSESEIRQKKGVVSMKAFAYNYRKFFIEEVYLFKNCLSETALRQRLIDLRMFLEPWFDRNIIFKYNHQFWKELELQCCAQLKRYKQTSIYTKVLSLIQLRNKIWLFMRTLSKVIYQLTDQKNIGLAAFNERVTIFIQKQTNDLSAWAEFVDQFETHLISTGNTRQQFFKITDLLQFSKAKFPQQMENILCYLRGIFKYLYFFKKNPLLTLNQETLKIDCQGIAQINLNLLMEFLDYKRQETHHLMELLESVCREVNETVEARPEVTGHKSFLHECNYLAETLLKMIKRCDFSVFNRLQSIRQLYLIGEISDTLRIKQILEQRRIDHDRSEVKEAFWKNMFSFYKEPIAPQNQQVVSKEEGHQKNYQAALEAYSQLRKRLQGKLPTQSQQYQDKQKDKEKDRVILPNQQKIDYVDKPNDQLLKQQQFTANGKHTCYDAAYCSLCDDICTTSLTSSLHNIDSMSAYIFDMLRDI